MTDITAVKPIEILLVEDNPGDVRLIQEVFREAKVMNNLRVAKDGVEALELLHKSALSHEGLLPDVILLDLNIPKKNGREVLADIKSDKRLQGIPVVILTSSMAEDDIVKTYELHGNCYISKPLDVDKFIAVVKAIEDFWLAVVKLPPREER